MKYADLALSNATFSSFRFLLNDEMSASRLVFLHFLKLLRIRDLKVNRRKNELTARVFAASEDGVKPIKTAVEVDTDLKTEYLAKLKIADRNIPDPFKIPHGWINEDEGIKFWPMLLYPDIF